MLKVRWQAFIRWWMRWSPLSDLGILVGMTFVIILLSVYLSGWQGIFIPISVFIIFALILVLIYRWIENCKVVCKECGERYLLSWRQKYCEKCGGLLIAIKEKERKCPKGHKIKDESKFCPICGVKLRENK